MKGHQVLSTLSGLYAFGHCSPYSNGILTHRISIASQNPEDGFIPIPPAEKLAISAGILGMEDDWPFPRPYKFSPSRQQGDVQS